MLCSKCGAAEAGVNGYCSSCETQSHDLKPTQVPPPPIISNATDITVLYSYARPFWYVVLMTVCTFGLYEIVWFYRAWNTLLEHYQLKGNSVVNAIFSPLCCWSFFRYAFSLAGTAGDSSSMTSNTAASLYFLFSVFGSIALNLADEIPGLSAVLTILGLILAAASIFIPLREGVEAMNAGYAWLQPGSRMRTRLSPWAIATIVIFGIFWLLFFLGLIMWAIGMNSFD